MAQAVHKQEARQQVCLRAQGGGTCNKHRSRKQVHLRRQCNRSFHTWHAFVPNSARRCKFKVPLSVSTVTEKWMWDTLLELPNGIQCLMCLCRWCITPWSIVFNCIETNLDSWKALMSRVGDVFRDSTNTPPKALLPFTRKKQQVLPNCSRKWMPLFCFFTLHTFAINFSSMKLLQAKKPTCTTHSNPPWVCNQIAGGSSRSSHQNVLTMAC